MEIATMPLNTFCAAYSKILLYGAGDLGHRYLCYFEASEIPVCAFVVSNKPVEPINGRTVYSVDQIPFSPAECGIILTLNSCFHTEVIQLLHQHGFHNIYIPSIEDKRAAVKAYASKRQAQMQEDMRNIIDFQSDIMTLGSFRMANPYLYQDGDEWLNAVLIEMGDLVLPVIGNYGYIDEGPYVMGSFQLNKGDIVIDCGANYGIFSAYAASCDCQVFAFEPTQLKLLEKNQKLYPDKIEIVPCAVSDKVGKERFILYDRPGINAIANNTLNKENRSIARVIQEVEVDSITIDSFVQNRSLTHVDFIKADIEGAERLMLKGAAWTLKTFAPKISICTYHYPDDKEVLEKLILQANPYYHIEHHYKKLYAYI